MMVWPNFVVLYFWRYRSTDKSEIFFGFVVKLDFFCLFIKNVLTSDQWFGRYRLRYFTDFFLFWSFFGNIQNGYYNKIFLNINKIFWDLKKNSRVSGLGKISSVPRYSKITLRQKKHYDSGNESSQKKLCSYLGTRVKIMYINYCNLFSNARTSIVILYNIFLPV